jgi:hypothetical protein
MRIAKATANAAPIVMLYGAEGRGKTTLATKFPSPVALLTERGIPRGITVDAFEDIKNYEAAAEALRDFCLKPGEYQTLIVDTVDSLEALLVDFVCRKNKWASIETPSFGRGWVAAGDEWQRLLRFLGAIRNKGVTIVLVCHAEIIRVEDPRAPSYTSYQPKLHKRARGLVMDACDAVLFIAEDLRTLTEDGGFSERTRATAGGGRYLFCEGRPAFAAKNRYGMPEKIPLPIDLNFSDIAKYWSQDQ